MNISEVRANEHIVGEKTAATLKKLHYHLRIRTQTSGPVFWETVIDICIVFTNGNSISCRRYSEKSIKIWKK